MVAVGVAALDGAWLASASGDGTVRIWDPRTGQGRQTRTALTHVVAAVGVAPDGSWLATASVDHTVRIWDLHTATCTTGLDREAADAFHTYRQRQIVRHAAAEDATRNAADALNDLAGGIGGAHAPAGRAAAVNADSDADQRIDRRGDPVLREKARDLLDTTRAELDSLHVRIHPRGQPGGSLVLLSP